MGGDGKMLIRKATREDLDTVVHIVHKTIADIYPAYYPAGAVIFFINHHSTEKIADDIENEHVFVLDESGNIVGTVTVKSNLINRLFVFPECQGKGYGRELMDYAEKTVFENFAFAQVDASLSAKAMYLKRGYVDEEYHCIKTDSGQFLCYDVMKKKNCNPLKHIHHG